MVWVEQFFVETFFIIFPHKKETTERKVGEKNWVKFNKESFFWPDFQSDTMLDNQQIVQKLIQTKERESILLQKKNV